jgi:hypothetical protein
MTTVTTEGGRDRVNRRACQLLAELYPGTVWEVATGSSPDMSLRGKASAASRKVEPLRAAEDDLHAL